MTTRQKPKRKYNKKIKQQIGRDLVKDTIGTNQLIDYNNFINMLEEKVKVDGEETNVKKYKVFDDTKIKRYKENLGEQLNNQQYNNDPNYQYQLKKNSKKLYNDIKESIFKGDEYVPPSTTKKRQSKFKYDNTPLTPFEMKLKAQTEKNIKTKRLKTKTPNIASILDRFLVDKSESLKDKIITPEIIKKWRDKFEKIEGFKEDDNLNENFSTIVLSYFDDTRQRQLIDNEKMFLKKYDERKQKEKEDNDLKKAEVYRIIQLQQKMERNEKLKIEENRIKEENNMLKKEKTFIKDFSLYKSNPDYTRIKKLFLDKKFNIASARKYLNMVKYSNNGEIKKTSLPNKRKLDNELSKYEWLINDLKI